MASPTATRIAAEQALLPPDVILEDIFLRLDSGADLARASATCCAFRRVATGRSFLRRFKSLHPPPIVGFIHFEAIRGLQPAEPPHRSAPAARALAQAGDYSFSFLPNDSRPNNSWFVRDCRDGRFLLSRDATDASRFLELVVCDPLYRRYVQIPPIPVDLVPPTPSRSIMKSEPFFWPSDEGGLEEVSHFRVIYNWLDNYKIVTFLFSAVTGKWCCATSFSFLPARLIVEVKRLKRYYACGSFYWVHHFEKHMLALDPCEMKFSLVPHDMAYYPARGFSLGLAVVDAAEDRLGLLTLQVTGDKLCLFTKIWQNNGVGAEEWRLDKYIPLPKVYHYYFILGAAEGYLLLGTPVYVDQGGETIRCFVLNLKTLLVERMCVLHDSFDATFHGHPYASYPPPLSPPSL